MGVVVGGKVEILMRVNDSDSVVRVKVGGVEVVLLNQVCIDYMHKCWISIWKPVSHEAVANANRSVENLNVRSELREGDDGGAACGGLRRGRRKRDQDLLHGAAGREEVGEGGGGRGGGGSARDRETEDGGGDRVGAGGEELPAGDPGAAEGEGTEEAAGSGGVQERG